MTCISQRWTRWKRRKLPTPVKKEEDIKNMYVPTVDQVGEEQGWEQSMKSGDSHDI